MAKPRISLYIITPLLTIIVSVILVEFGLAVIYPSPFSMETNMYFEPDPYTGYRSKPNSQGTYYNDIPANANSQGLRDKEYSFERTPGVDRILVLGDSFTVGANVEAQDAYAKQLEDILNSESDAEIEVINTGVGGWSPYQYRQYYEHYGRAFDPDVVIVGLFVGNDTYIDQFSHGDLLTAVRGRRIRQAAAAQKLTRLKVLLYNNSHLARLVMNIGVATNQDFSREDCAQFLSSYVAIQGGRMPNHLLRTADRDILAGKNIDEILKIKSMTDADGDELLVVIIPDENQLNPLLQQEIIAESDFDKYDFDLPQSLLVSLLQQNNVEVLDLKPAFEKDERCLYMNDTHWVPEGHGLAAEKIAEKLKQ